MPIGILTDLEEEKESSKLSPLYQALENSFLFYVVILSTASLQKEKLTLID